jgi:Tfp pilus assembly protein PilX
MKQITSPRRQQGFTVAVVLVLLSVMLVGGFALARMSDVGTLAAGNVATKDASVLASEIGLTTAFQRIVAYTTKNTPDPAWYSPVALPDDKNGLPTVNWSTLDATNIGAEGRYEMRYMVDRMCQNAVITDLMRDCLVRRMQETQSRRAGVENPDPRGAAQFRITVQVRDGRGTETYVQSMVTPGITSALGE